jgi:hypothetical protein
MNVCIGEWEIANERVGEQWLEAASVRGVWNSDEPTSEWMMEKAKVIELVIWYETDWLIQVAARSNA